jgi:hypothetical protein
MTTFTYDAPASYTTPRGTLRLFAYHNARGFVVTETECGGTVVKNTKGLKDSAGDIHPIENAEQTEQTVADILSNESGETVTAADIKKLWAKLA